MIDLLSFAAGAVAMAGAFGMGWMIGATVNNLRAADAIRRAHFGRRA